MEQNDYLTFMVGHEYFAINVKHVKEVLIYQYYTQQPNDETQIAGMLNFNGKILPVIDSEKRLNVTCTKKHSNHTIIVFEIKHYNEKYQIAANANAIDEILSVSVNEMTTLNRKQIEKVKTNCIKGTIMHHRQKIQVIDADKFFDLPNLDQTNALNFNLLGIA